MPCAPKWDMTKRLLLLGFVVALFAPACVAPTPEVDEEEGESSSSIVSGAGGACPVNARLSQGFSRSHDGVDLASPIGTPIYAVMAGKVTASGPAQGYGQWIRIQHDDGSMTEYGHMSKRFVAVGARVKAGQKIASVGSEGRSTGPHLHLRTYRSASKVGTGNGMNPTEYLRARGVSVPCKPTGGVVEPAPANAPADEGSDPPTNNNANTSNGNGNGASTSTANVTVWTDVDIRSQPRLSAAIVGKAADDTSLPGFCWTEGDTVTSFEYSHNMWVKVQASNGKTGYVSGVFLTGDQTGGIGNECD
jgi:hypothetical protein